MRILIEEFQYNVTDIKDILCGIDALENVEGKVSVHYVGYFYNTLLKDCVFILPKVLLKDVDGQELVFGKYQPEDIAYLAENNPLDAFYISLPYGFIEQLLFIRTTNATIPILYITHKSPKLVMASAD